MPWPRNLPDDLRRRLEGVMGYRQFGAAEIWDEVRAWLEERGIEPPSTPPSSNPEKSG